MARLSLSYHNFINQISTTYEPKYYHQAVPYSKWRQTMIEEIQTLEACGGANHKQVK